MGSLLRSPANREKIHTSPCSLAYHSAGELSRLISTFTGYQLHAFQKEPGVCKGYFCIGVHSPSAFSMAYSASAPVLFSGLRNLDLVIFVAAPPINADGSKETLLFWKNEQLPGQLLGGFCLSEAVCHYTISPNCMHVMLAVKRSKILSHLDRPQYQQVLSYMTAANSCVLPLPIYERFVKTVMASAFYAPSVAKDCLIGPVIEQLNDANYAHALPAKQFLPSAQQLLAATRTIDEHIFDGINVADLGRITGLGRTQLNAACQEVYACSPKELIRSIRLEESMLLLRSPSERALHGLDTIADIHDFVGINSSSSFRKQFGEWFLAKPSDFWVY